MSKNILYYISYKVTIPILINIKDECYATKIFKELDKKVSYEQIVSKLNIFEKFGLLISKKDGRVKRYSLTKKGLKIQRLLRSIYWDLEKHNLTEVKRGNMKEKYCKICAERLNIYGECEECIKRSLK